MRGDLVVVRAFGNKPLVRRVWEAKPQRIMIIDEDNYQLLCADAGGLAPMGWARNDVFYYDEVLLNAFATRKIRESELWKQLKVYREVGV